MTGVNTERLSILYLSTCQYRDGKHCNRNDLTKARSLSVFCSPWVVEPGYADSFSNAKGEVEHNSGKGRLERVAISIEKVRKSCYLVEPISSVTVVCCKTAFCCMATRRCPENWLHMSFGINDGLRKNLAPSPGDGAFRGSSKRGRVV